jgi:aconitate hydratase
MGVLPLTFKEGVTRKTLRLTGVERISITGLAGGIRPRMDVIMRIERADGVSEEVPLLCRIDTLDELEYYKNGGILPFVVKNLLGAARAAA